MSVSIIRVGGFIGQKSSDKAQEKEQSEEVKSDEHDKEAIGTLSKQTVGYLFDH